MYKIRNWIDTERLYWYALSRNPAAIHILEKSPNKIDWNMLSENLGIYTYDYNAMKE